MDDILASEQRTQLDALLIKLEALPTPELICEANRLRLPVPMDDKSKKQMRLAVAGGISAQKLLAYIEEFRDVEDRRLELGKEIYRKLQDARVWRAMQSLDAAKPLVEASQLADGQEVMYHFFAVTVGRIERFLEIAARAAGRKISKEDRELLASFRELRNFYEHMEDELPGRKSYTTAAHEDEVDGMLHIRMGLNVDEQGRFVVNGVAVDVSARGLKAVEALLRRASQGCPNSGPQAFRG